MCANYSCAAEENQEPTTELPDVTMLLIRRGRVNGRLSLALVELRRLSYNVCERVVELLCGFAGNSFHIWCLVPVATITDGNGSSVFIGFTLVAGDYNS